MAIDPLRRWEIEEDGISYLLLDNFVLIKQQAQSDNKPKVTQMNPFGLFCASPNNLFAPPDLERHILQTILDYIDPDEIEIPLLRQAMRITDAFYGKDLEGKAIKLHYEANYQGPSIIQFEPFGAVLCKNDNAADLEKTYLSYSRLFLAGPGLPGLTRDTHQEIQKNLLDVALSGAISKADIYSVFDVDKLSGYSFRKAYQHTNRSAVFELRTSSLEFTLIKTEPSKKPIKNTLQLALEDIKYFDYSYNALLTLGYLPEENFRLLQKYLLESQISGNPYSLSTMK